MARLLCKRGLHDLGDPENVYVQPSNGIRHCKPCKDASDCSSAKPTCSFGYCE